jgi:hypothetical protein
LQRKKRGPDQKNDKKIIFCLLDRNDLRQGKMFNCVIVLSLLLALSSKVQAGCDNQCSGHGTCGFDEICTCYDNWGVGLTHDSGDCSERVCPYEIAWIDTPTFDGLFHNYAECANRGICDRSTGECQCFDGYEGKGCQRTSCPNDCSGHGTCEYIEDMEFDQSWDDLSVQVYRDTMATYTYTNWDEHKIRGCVCDATYTDTDCSKRLCPHGTDVLDQRDNLLVSAKYQKQTILIPASSTLSADVYAETFALTFKSRLNETFTTYPIVAPSDDETADKAAFANDVRLALLKLPNRVIDDVTVSVDQISWSGGTAGTQNFRITIQFSGDAVQGQQHLLLLESYACLAGCTPRISGMNLQTRVGAGPANTSQVTYSTYNSYECGRRGKCDYTTGLCSCFTGYTGENCNTLTTLV